MENPASVAYLQQESINLKKLVTRLVAGVLPATPHDSLVSMEGIPDYLAVCNNRDGITVVLSKVFTTLATYMDTMKIAVSARLEQHLVVITIEGPHRVDVFGIGSSLQSVQPITEQVGGYLSINSQQDAGTVIVFSFPVV